MSEAEAKLTELQFWILDAMADDAENIEQIYLWANSDFAQEKRLPVDLVQRKILHGRFLLHILIDEVVRMLKEGYIQAKYSHNEGVAPLVPVNLTALHYYWFAPTEKGRIAWDAYRFEELHGSK